ncbi:hypothetical protein M422DRAFT_28916 [Sphaerobolus stellatus SS14]|nr:hypothetical protein M422DRAFT_28916 [Sphaerobolus stellatus SS14]
MDPFSGPLASRFGVRSRPSKLVCVSAESSSVFGDSDPMDIDEHVQPPDNHSLPNPSTSLSNVSSQRP